jgi:hypothetical protein
LKKLPKAKKSAKNYESYLPLWEYGNLCIFRTTVLKKLNTFVSIPLMEKWKNNCSDSTVSKIYVKIDKNRTTMSQPLC